MGVGLLALTLDTGRVRFNYDFSALEDSSLPSFVFDKITNRVLGYSQTPVVMFTPDAEQRARRRPELTRRKANGARSRPSTSWARWTIWCRSQQTEKQEVLASIGEMLAKVKRDKLDAKTQARFDELSTMVKAQPSRASSCPRACAGSSWASTGGQRLRAGVRQREPRRRRAGARVRPRGAGGRVPGGAGRSPPPARP